MEKKYYDPADLKKFGNITEWQEAMGKKFFDWYGEVFKEGALTEREKALIALAVAHAEACPYCIDAYSSTCLEKGADERTNDGSYTRGGSYQRWCNASKRRTK